MSFLLYVEFDAASESTATMILESLDAMSALVHRDHATVYTYVFRRDIEDGKKLIFTELYADEQVFLNHGNDPEFGKLLLKAFDTTTGKSRKELCIRNNIDDPLLPITATILDNYLHVTYIPLEQGFFRRNQVDKHEFDMLVVCTGCDENVYERLNALVHCVTCLAFKESDVNRQLIAVITNITRDQQPVQHVKPLVDNIEIVCSHEESIRKLKDILDIHFQIRSIHIQTSFAGYIRH